MPRKDREQKLEYERIYREQNKELLRQKALARYYANREAINEKRNAKLREQRARLREDPQAYAEYLEKRRIESAEFRANNRDKVNALVRQWHANKRLEQNFLEKERERLREQKRQDRRVLSDSYIRNQAARYHMSTAKHYPDVFIEVDRLLVQIRRKTNPNRLRGTL